MARMHRPLTKEELNKLSISEDEMNVSAIQ